MKFKTGDVVYPIIYWNKFEILPIEYDPGLILGYDEKKGMYAVGSFDIDEPDTLISWSFIKEEDLGLFKDIEPRFDLLPDFGDVDLKKERYIEFYSIGYNAFKEFHEHKISERELKKRLHELEREPRNEPLYYEGEINLK